MIRIRRKRLVACWCVLPMLISASLLPRAAGAAEERQLPEKEATAAQPTTESIAQRLIEIDALLRLVQGTPGGQVGIDELLVDLPDDPQARKAVAAAFRARAVSDVPEIVPRVLMPGGRLPATAPTAADLLQRLPETDVDVQRLDAYADWLRLQLLELPDDEFTALRRADEKWQATRRQMLAAAEEQRIAQEAARRAEEARKVALAQAQQAASLAERALADLRAQIESHRQLLASYVAQTASLRVRLAEEAAAARQDLLAKAEALQTVTTTEEYETLYARWLTDGEALQRALSASLNQFRSAEPAPLPALPERTASLKTVDPEAWQAILDAFEQLRTDAEIATAQRLEVLWAVVDLRWQSSRTLYRLVLKALDRAAGGRVLVLLGFGERARRQLGYESRQLLAEWDVFSTGAQRIAGASFSALLSKPDALVALVSRILLFCGLLWGLHGPVLRRLEQVAEPTSRKRFEPGFSRMLRKIATAVLPLYRASINLLAALALTWWFDIDSEHPVYPLTRFVVFVTAWNLVLQIIRRAARGLFGKQITGERRQLVARVEETISRLGMFALFWVLVMSMVAIPAGRGYIWHLFRVAAWLSGIVAGVVVLRRWQPDIAAGFLNVSERGVLADLVRRYRDRAFGTAVVAVAFLLLLARSLFVAIQNLLLEFDQTRQLLALLFRKRMQWRQAEQAGRPVGEQGLPEGVDEALRADPDPEAGTVVDHFPHLQEVLAEIAQALENGESESILLVGDQGIGRSLWLERAAKALVDQQADVALVRIAIARRPADIAAMFRSIMMQFDIEPDAIEEAAGNDPERVASRLRTTYARCVVLVDDTHRLFVRGLPETLHVWNAFEQLVESTASNLTWVATKASIPHAYQAWIQGSETGVFRSIYRLPAWEEEEIRQLLESRVRAAGYRLSYRELIGQAVRAEEIEATARDFHRLLWTQSMGNPRAALALWRRSLFLRDEDVVAVRMFEEPDSDRLDELDDAQRFVLATIVWNAGLGLSQCAQSLQMPLYKVRETYRRLLDAGVIRLRNNGEAEITGWWWPTVIRFLRRNNLIR